MGMPTGISNCSSTSCQPAVITQQIVKSDPRNPDPTRFRFEKFASRGGHTACVVVYPNCTNYEGKKILVMPCTKQQLEQMTVLDPHFCDSEHLSPVARFEPTDKGWELANKLLDILNVA